MADTTLNRFLASGTAAERAAFTPSPPTPASGPSPTYVWHEEDTGNTYSWRHDTSAWVQINVAGIAATTTEQLTGTEASKYSSPNTVAALWEQGPDIASAATISVGEGGYFVVTGTTTITDIDFATDRAGRAVWVKFAGVLTLTHNATTLILPTGANITTAAGDTACFISEGTDNVRCVAYQRANGGPIQNFRGALVTKSANELTANYSTSRIVTWDSEAYDTSGIAPYTSTVTITIASPGVVTWTGHTFLANSPVVFTTTGALPTGLTPGTTYYVVSPVADTFSVSATIGGAAINTSGTQSGTHTGTNYSRLTVPSGVTRVKLKVQMGMLLVTSGAIMVLSIFKNGSSSYAGHPTSRDAIANTDPEFQTISPALVVNDGDYFEANFTNTDTSITVDSTRSWFAMEIIE